MELDFYSPIRLHGVVFNFKHGIHLHEMVLSWAQGEIYLTWSLVKLICSE